MKSRMLVSVLIILFLAFLPLTSAVVNDFNAAAKETVPVCACSVTEQKIALANGDFATTLSIQQSGPATKYVTLAQSFVRLEPRERKTVSYYVAPACGADEDLRLVTDIVSDIGVKKSLAQKIAVSRCDNVGINPKINYQAGCRCSQNEFRAEVVNLGSWEDTYYFSVDKFEAQATLVPAAATLKPGQKQLVQVFLTPECQVKGKQNFNLIVSSRNAGFSEKHPLALSLNAACADTQYNITAPAGRFGGIFGKMKISLGNYRDVLGSALLYLPFTITTLLILAAAYVSARYAKPRPLLRTQKPEAAFGWKKHFKAGKGIRKGEAREAAKYEIPRTKLRTKWFVIGLAVFAVVAALVFAAANTNYLSGLSNIFAFKPAPSGAVPESPVPGPEAPEAPSPAPETPSEAQPAEGPKVQLIPAAARFVSVAYSLAKPYLYYILGGIAVLIVLIFVLSKLGKREWEETGETPVPAPEVKAPKPAKAKKVVEAKAPETYGAKLQEERPFVKFLVALIIIAGLAGLAYYFRSRIAGYAEIMISKTVTAYAYVSGLVQGYPKYVLAGFGILVALIIAIKFLEFLFERFFGSQK